MMEWPPAEVTMSRGDIRLLLQNVVVVLGLLLLQDRGEDCNHGALVCNILCGQVTNMAMSLEMVGYIYL